MLARLARRAILRRFRSYATAATNDPSKIRNIALVAHIGRSISSCSISEVRQFTHRLRKDHSDRVDPPHLKLSLFCRVCGHRKHHYRFLARRARTRDHHPVRQHPCEMEEVDLQPHRHSRACGFWDGSRKRKSSRRWCRRTHRLG